MSEPEQESRVPKGDGPTWGVELSEKAVDMMMAQHGEPKWTEEASTWTGGSKQVFRM